jgi:hypothetical protein
MPKKLRWPKFPKADSSLAAVLPQIAEINRKEAEKRKLEAQQKQADEKKKKKDEVGAAILAQEFVDRLQKR